MLCWLRHICSEKLEVVSSEQIRPVPNPPQEMTPPDHRSASLIEESQEYHGNIAHTACVYSHRQFPLGVQVYFSLIDLMCRVAIVPGVQKHTIN